MKPKHILASLILNILISTLNSYALAEGVKIGALVCLTGPCATVGSSSLKGIQLAIEQIKERDGIDIELLTENSDELSGSGPVTAYHSLRRRMDNALIIGPSWSVGGMAIVPIASKDEKVLLFSPSLGVREFNEAGERIFNIWPHDDVGTKALAKRAFDSGKRKIAIFSQISPWDLTQSKTFKEEFERLGGEINPYIEYPMNETELKAYVLKIIRSKPDATFLSTFQAGLMAKELKRYGYKGGKYAPYIDKIQVEQSQGSLEGLEFSFQPEGSKEFTDAFVKKFNEKPNTSADTAYDALNLIYKSIKETKSQDPAVVSKHMLTIKNYPGASGDITFDEKGGITRPPAFFVLKRGEV